MATQKRPITLGLIGAGHWGKNYITTIESLQVCRLKYVCARTSATLNLLPETYTKTTNYRDFFTYPDLDGIIIATPEVTHYKIARDFLEQGYNIFVEKPLATSYPDALKLGKVAARKGCQVLVGHVHLYNPAYLKAKELIEEIGQIQYIAFETTNNGPFRDDISVLWDWGPHGIYLAMDMMGKEPTELSAWAVNKLRPTQNLYDLVWLNLKFDNQTSAFLKMGWLAPIKRVNMTVVGTKSTIVFDDTNERKVTYYKDIGPLLGNHRITRQEPKINCPAYSSQAPLKLEVLEFIKSIKTGSKPKTDITQGIKVAKILHLAEQSILKNGKAIKVP